MLMRVAIYAISLIVIALLVPDIDFAEKSIEILLVASITLGILIAIVKPLIQFLTFQIIFASYGIVIVLINAFVLWLVSALFPEWFQVNGFFWALVGGALLGVVTSFLEALFGLSIPIVPAEDVELRGLIKEGKGSDALNKILEQKEGILGPNVDPDVSLTADEAPVELPNDAAGHVPTPAGNDVEPMPSNQTLSEDNIL